jgi:hypothetical protein
MLLAGESDGNIDSGKHYDCAEADSNVKQPAEKEYTKRFEFARLHVLALYENACLAPSLHGINCDDPAAASR